MIEMTYFGSCVTLPFSFKQEIGSAWSTSIVHFEHAEAYFVPYMLHKVPVVNKAYLKIEKSKSNETSCILKMI